MDKTTLKTSIGLVALLVLSACATQETSEQVTDETLKCRPNETRVCDEFAGETSNCSCEKGDDIRKMLDAYETPDY